MEIAPLDLLNAYCEGIFPMGEDGGGVNWYRPKMRGILPIADFHLPRRFARFYRSHPFELRWNSAFGDVMRGCADREETWITPAILDVYEELHRMGHAHSAEVWREGRLVGGVYGVTIGGAFFGESMFSRETHASKVALTALQHRLHERGFILHDTQWTTPHLAMFGGHEIPCADYLTVLDHAIRLPVHFDEHMPPTTLIFR
ncbi:MAG: leucyl/phenylalanyl-tRNA--protein transferase [Verrucomicrobiaceae bacterium]|nr:leucyl/phenylalanyl-tRNA--protein transferase [Verrucomicrobiaceae bacterium]